MKREGEEGEELKLPGKERNRVGLNLLDCFQLHASSLSLSLYSFLSLFSFLLSRRHSSTIPSVLPSPIFSLIAVKRRSMVQGEPSQFESIPSTELSSG